MTWRHSSGVRSPISRDIPIPATLASTSSRPWRSSDEGHRLGARCGVPDVADDVAGVASVTSLRTTVAPSSASRAATAAPMPLAAPETSATSPFEPCHRVDGSAGMRAHYCDAHGISRRKGRRRHRRRRRDRAGVGPDLRPRGGQRRGGRHRRGRRPRDGGADRGDRRAGQLRPDRRERERRTSRPWCSMPSTPTAGSTAPTTTPGWRHPWPRWRTIPTTAGTAPWPSCSPASTTA